MVPLAESRPALFGSRRWRWMVVLLATFAIPVLEGSPSALAIGGLAAPHALASPDAGGAGYGYDLRAASTTRAANMRIDAQQARRGSRTESRASTSSKSPSLAAKAGDDVAGAATDAARVARQPSTPWGRTIQNFKENPDDWRRVSAHAEEATSKTYRGSVSVEEVFERGSDRLVRHRIYGPWGEILHQTFRPYAKFGAP